MTIERYGDAHAALRAWAGRVTGDAREVAQSQVTRALEDILSFTPLVDRDDLVIRFFDVVVDQNAQWVEGSMTLHDDYNKTIVLTDLTFMWERPAALKLKLKLIPFSDHKTLAEILAS